MTIVFETPGWLDIQAITTFGLNAKPNSKSPIGHFGTGLKYALAVLLREGCKVSMVIGNRRVDFRSEEREFRGETFNRCIATVPGLSVPGLGWAARKDIQLPFTTDLGKGWVMWQAFRELFSNTLDEGGEAYLRPGDWVVPKEESRTFILVEGEAFEREYENRWDTFLQAGIRERGTGVQILAGPSQYIYYRGVRVVELKKPSANTYNILGQLELTEDRTAKYQFYVDNHVRQALMECEDTLLVDSALNADESHYESGLDFSEMSNWITPSGTFMHIGGGSSNRTARKLLRRREQASMVAAKQLHFTELLAEAITDGDWSLFTQIAEENADELYTLLKGLRPASNEAEAEYVTVGQLPEGEFKYKGYDPESNSLVFQEVDKDEIPF